MLRLPRAPHPPWVPATACSLTAHTQALPRCCRTPALHTLNASATAPHTTHPRRPPSWQCCISAGQRLAPP
eukprot:scaffold91612_cov30-Phaeocystis_antarctica.AAC.1